VLIPLARRVAKAGGAALFCILATACNSGDSGEAPGWPAWERFAARFVQDGGRVVDLTFDRRTVSEGQGYALFFALVAGDRARYDQILAWTSKELAGGKLGEQLPAWHWGRRDDGSWGVLDHNAASDADLWLCYALLEGGRLWNAPRYRELGRNLLDQIRTRETVVAGRAGPVLLPAPEGFRYNDLQFWSDPSYMPGFILADLAQVDPQGPWQAIWDRYLKAAPQVSPAGVAPNLYEADADGSIRQDSARTPLGSYDAIRVYLWAGMSPTSSAPLLHQLTPFAALIERLGGPPEQVDPRTGLPLDPKNKPIGFAGAVLPFLHAVGANGAYDHQVNRLRLHRLMTMVGRGGNYYDEALILFGTGFADGVYRFDERGQLKVRWADQARRAGAPRPTSRRRARGATRPRHSAGRKRTSDRAPGSGGPAGAGSATAGRSTRGRRAASSAARAVRRR